MGIPRNHASLTWILATLVTAITGCIEKAPPPPVADMTDEFANLVQQFVPDCYSPENLVEEMEIEDGDGPAYRLFFGRERLMEYFCKKDSTSILLHRFGNFFAWATIDVPWSDSLYMRMKSLVASFRQLPADSFPTILNTSLMRCETPFTHNVSQYHINRDGFNWIVGIFRSESRTGDVVSVSILPSSDIRGFLQNPDSVRIDTIEGSLYRWSGYDYICYTDKDTCVDGFPAVYSIAPNEIYRVVLSPGYRILQVCEEPLRYDSSCTDVRRARLVGFVGPYASVPHSGLSVKTFFALQGKMVEE